MCYYPIQTDHVRELKKVTVAVSGLGVTRLNCNPFHYRTLSESKDSCSESESFQRLNFFRVSNRESEN